MLGNRESISVCAEDINPFPATVSFKGAFGYFGGGEYLPSLHFHLWDSFENSFTRLRGDVFLHKGVKECLLGHCQGMIMTLGLNVPTALPSQGQCVAVSSLRSARIGSC